MTTARRSPSLLGLIKWATVGPFVVLGGLLLLVLAFGALGMAIRLFLALLA